MKSMRFLILLIVLPFFSAAQDCKLKSETDPFTKETKLSSGFINLDGGSVTIDADSKELVFLFNVEGPDRCFDNNTTLDVFFEGIKSKMQSRNGGTMNCEGLFQVVFKNSNSNPTTLLQRLSTKKVTQFIFNVDGKKPVTITVGPKEQEAILAFSNCIITQGRTLIK
jgi:hypothetical protein